MKDSGASKPRTFRGARALRLALGTCSLLACEPDQLEVLTPGASSAGAAATNTPPPPPERPSACAFYPEPACARQLGQDCGNEHECCSGACVAGLKAKKSCAAAISCKSYCETCQLADECCSGSCEPDDRGALRCVSSTCLREGEICNKPEDCCTDEGAVKCEEDPKGLKTKRCRLEASGLACVANGFKCNAAEECCSGDCVASGAKDSTCKATCYAAGEPCDESLPCCASDAQCVGKPTPSCQTIMH